MGIKSIDFGMFLGRTSGKRRGDATQPRAWNRRHAATGCGLGVFCEMHFDKSDKSPEWLLTSGGIKLEPMSLVSLSFIFNGALLSFQRQLAMRYLDFPNLERDTLGWWGGLGGWGAPN